MTWILWVLAVLAGILAAVGGATLCVLKDSQRRDTAAIEAFEKWVRARDRPSDPITRADRELRGPHASRPSGATSDGGCG